MGQTHQTVKLDYGEVSAALSKLQSGLDAPEVHGLLVGMLSSGVDTSGLAWFAPIVGTSDVDMNDVVLKEMRNYFLMVAEITHQHLQSEALDFMPLLPEDDKPLGQRVKALSEWCSGFLAGLGLSEGLELETLDDEAKELLVDLQQMAQLDEFVNDDEEEEAAFFECVEYVRMGALFLFCSLSLQGQAEAEQTGAEIQ